MPRNGWRTCTRLARKHVRFAALYWQYRRTLRRVIRDTTPYNDLAMTPPEAAEADALDLYKATRGGEAEAARLRRRPFPVRVAAR